MQASTTQSDMKLVRTGRKMLVAMPVAPVPETKALINITNEMFKISAMEYLLKAVLNFSMGMYIIVTGEMESMGFNHLQSCVNQLKEAEKTTLHYFE